MSKQEKLKVLFVDDEANVLNAIRRAVQEEDYEALFLKAAKKRWIYWQQGILPCLLPICVCPKWTGCSF